MTSGMSDLTSPVWPRKLTFTMSSPNEPEDGMVLEGRLGWGSVPSWEFMVACMWPWSLVVGNSQGYKKSKRYVYADESSAIAASRSRFVFGHFQS